MNVNIEPVQIVHTCERVQINVEDFTLHATTGVCRVFFYNREGIVVRVERVEIPEDVYVNWGTDDQVIVDYVLETLNLISV